MVQSSNFIIVESPLTSGKLLTAMTTVVTIVGTSGVPLMASFNQGRSMMVGFVENDPA